MKKNLVRFVALALVAILALALLPLGAMAVTVNIYSESYQKQNPTVKDFSDPDAYQPYQSHGSVSGSSVTIKTSDYDKLVTIGGEQYDLKGIVDGFKTDFTKDANQIIYASSVTITNSNANKWYGYDPYSGNVYAYLSYVPHAHKLSSWISDGTTHWRKCLVCEENFIYQTWCQDGDEDGVCNVCGGDVPYHDITVIESEGGKVTVNKETAANHTKITADVTPADGYKLNKLHFTKVREDGSKQEITRNKQGSQYWTYMPTYDLEVTAEFIKK